MIQGSPNNNGKKEKLHLQPGACMKEETYSITLVAIVDWLVVRKQVSALFVHAMRVHVQ